MLPVSPKDAPDHWLYIYQLQPNFHPTVVKKEEEVADDIESTIAASCTTESDTEPLPILPQLPELPKLPKLDPVIPPLNFDWGNYEFGEQCEDYTSIREACKNMCLVKGSSTDYDEQP